MQKGFFFIDGVQPDRAAQKSMRRHVMKGKNAGKKLVRPSRLKQQTKPHEIKVLDVGNRSRERQGAGQIFAPCDTLGDPVLTTTLLPMLGVDAYSLGIINLFCDLTVERLYTMVLGLSLHEIKLLWFRWLFTDEAAFHCYLSLMQACNEIFLSDGNSPKKALYHLSQTFTQIQKRLDSEDALSDSTIALISSLIFQEQIRNQFEAAQVHAQGLQRIIQLRGGLDQLEGNATLVLNICKADIMLAWQHGGPTMFFRDRMPEVRQILASEGYHLDHPVLPSTPFHELDPSLQGVLSDVMGLCWFVNHHPQQPQFAFVLFEEIFVSVCYRLLQFRTLNESRIQRDSQTEYHLGLLLFMVGSCFQTNGKRIVDFRLVSLCFKEFLDSGLVLLGNDSTLWLMVLGGMCNLGEDDTDWIAGKMWLLAQARGIYSWEDAQSSICRFPWIHAVHDQSGRELWDRVLYSRQLPAC